MKEPAALRPAAAPNRQAIVAVALSFDIASNRRDAEAATWVDELVTVTADVVPEIEDAGDCPVLVTMVEREELPVSCFAEVAAPVGNAGVPEFVTGTGLLGETVTRWPSAPMKVRTFCAETG